MKEDLQFAPNVLQSVEQVTLQNRALQYGDAVFETLRIQNNKIIFWEDHYFRLMASMRILRMEIPTAFTPEGLQDYILSKLETSVTSARVKLVVFRDSNGLYLPDSNKVSFFIQVKPADFSNYQLSDKPCLLGLYKEHYIQKALLSNLKTTQKLPYVLGSIFAKEQGFDNLLVCNTDKMISEFLNGNLFAVFDNVIKTPDLSQGCLKGIIRKQIIEIADKHQDYTIEETSLTPFDILKADELWVTNVIQGIQTVTQFRKKMFENKIAKVFVDLLNKRAVQEGIF